MINTVKEFKIWRAHFCYSPKGKQAIDQMKQLKQGENEFPYGNLESSVLSACFIATKYDPKKDELDFRRRIGGIQLSTSAVKGRSKHKPQNVGRNSLILYLSSFFRFYTGDESIYDWVGIRLPDFGEGQSELITKFVNAVYPKTNIIPSTIERFINKSKNEGVRLAHWKLQD
jgi:hypothetical protein